MTYLVQKTLKHQHASWIELHAERLLANLEVLQKHSGTLDVLAVTKANAYGHGLNEIVKILDGNVSLFGVATLREALGLKECYPHTPVFLFGHLYPHEIPAAVGANIIMSVSNLEKAKAISDCSENLGRKTSIHIKIDTGMGRMGFNLEEAEGEIMKMRSLKGLLLDGIYTHFAAAEINDEFRAQQIGLFNSLIENLERKGIVFRYRHAQNSAASLTLFSPLLNLIRPGLALYGIYPDPSLQHTAELSSVLSLKSRVSLVKKIEAGQSVGYGREFVAKKTTIVAVLPFGYSHGYPFRAWQEASVLYNGKRYPLAGKVSMDYLTVDLGQETAIEGDVMTLIGEDSQEKITAEDIACWAGTIPYEIVTRLNPHIPKIIIS